MGPRARGTLVLLDSESHPYIPDSEACSRHHPDQGFCDNISVDKAHSGCLVSWIQFLCILPSLDEKLLNNGVSYFICFLEAERMSWVAAGHAQYEGVIQVASLLVYVEVDHGCLRRLRFIIDSGSLRLCQLEIGGQNLKYAFRFLLLSYEQSC